MDGCNAVYNAGFRTLKVYCTSAYLTDYPLQTSWSSTPTTLTQLAQTTQFATALTMGWNTVILTVFPFTTNLGGVVTNWWRSNPSTANYVAEYTEIYNLACYLLSTYNGTGRRFVLQNWEGDWAFMDAFVSETYVPQWMVDRYVAFFGARKRAVEDARRATASDCSVLMALEANKILEARTKPHLRRILRDIAPRIQPDVVSWSAYDGTIDTAIGFGADYATWATYTIPLMTKALRQLQLMFPGVPIQVGEFGYPEVQATGLGRDITPMINAFATAARNVGTKDFVYWEVFDNEESSPGNPKGYWTVKPDGTVTVAGAAMAALP